MILGILIVVVLLTNALMGLLTDDPRTVFHSALGAIGWCLFLGADYL